jgi:L-ascorbate metabolism protein UlaG (beta-lactamase superfamily)
MRKNAQVRRIFENQGTLWFCERRPVSLRYPTVVNPFRKKLTAEIRKSPNPPGPEQESGIHRVGLAPAPDWTSRNPITGILLPSLLSRREGQPFQPVWPRVGSGEVAVTWIGHASFLIQAGGLNVLIDPVFGNWVKGIKRMRCPGVALGDLPPIDLVLVTHAHFDHLDRRSLRQVARRQPIVVPFEVGNLVDDLGFGWVQELNTWDSFEIGPVRVTLTPCYHWGARVLHDSYRGFGGFILEVDGRVLYHGGDSAFFAGFGEIGRRFPIDVALLPIGAYDPPSHRTVHMNPEEALLAFEQLGARVMVPMHYGTFRLSYEPLEEPPQRLRSAAHQRGLLDRIAWMREGCPAVF